MIPIKIIQKVVITCKTPCFRSNITLNKFGVYEFPFKANFNVKFADFFGFISFFLVQWEARRKAFAINVNPNSVNLYSFTYARSCRAVFRSLSYWITVDCEIMYKKMEIKKLRCLLFTSGSFCKKKRENCAAVKYLFISVVLWICPQPRKVYKQVN